MKYNQGLCAQVKSIPSGVCGMVFGKSKQFFSPDFYIEMRQGSGVFPSLAVKSERPHLEATSLSVSAFKVHSFFSK